MDPLLLLDRLYPPAHPARDLLLEHSLAVADLAMTIAARFAAEVDAALVREAALLHDIGIHFTRAPDIGCNGPLPYLRHGLAGGAYLRRHGLERHALVCERHIGVGLSSADIRAGKLPLPARDFIPVTLEEEIVAYADLFFSKTRRNPERRRSHDDVRRQLVRFGVNKVEIFDAWTARFEF